MMTSKKEWRASSGFSIQPIFCPNSVKAQVILSEVCPT
jgi:hypothetical protein